MSERIKFNEVGANDWMDNATNWEKNEKALLVYGRGKSLFADMLAKKMGGKGRDFWTSPARVERKGFLNGYLEKRRLLILEDYNEHDDDTKSLIKSDKILIHRMADDDKLIENRLNILLLSDNPIESDDIINAPALEAIAILHYLTT